MIGTDLFQILVLALLLISVVALLGVVSTLSAIRKALGDRQAAAGSGASPAGQAAGGPAAQQPSAAQPATGQAQPATAGTGPEPSTAAPRAGGYAAAGSSPGGGGATATPAQAVSQSAAATSTAQEPQEQPFERDGRWWFRRGNELLVYDDQAGQWVPAPEQASGSVDTAFVSLHDTPTAAPAAAGGAPATGAAQGEGFWKCPSCGAVNGSTAASCRMCFTARP